MGYTHYFKFKKAPAKKAAQVEALYKKTLTECQKIVLFYSKTNGGLSGYSAHSKLSAYGGLNFNGSGENGHETFVLREHYSENESFNFCKTAQKPYDVVVTACLIVLAHRLKGLIEVSSDGRAEDFTAGLDLAKTVLKLKTLKIPVGA